MQNYLFIGGYQDGLSHPVSDDAESVQTPVGRIADEIYFRETLSGLGGDERRYSLPCSSMYLRNISILAPPLEIRQYEQCQNTGFR